ncbi:methylated-DNA--[protein]-cysteine S-methyltransferase [Synechococcus sp. Nb3U1]|uniref:methylated-DNA--[protein]-cysteine S-methyltransferase n=1 Tax=Synechococcus sp. Nb3U1 TaxID=1914529 RepID=UPI001F350503|nr:methylated-DNA--[protein]-cysteine S-methyltransferase [Synechococcus sp. Nb3U1]MCF2970744.1 methylated-DNA--[protein]-cysteine S-methyltransferase [Synechococcus sp. Nb3U1]
MSFSIPLYWDRLTDGIPAALAADLILVSDGHALLALEFSPFERRLREQMEKRFREVDWIPRANLQGVREAVRAYFAGEWDPIQALPVNPGGTPFQQQVWQMLRGIPVGETRTYGELAAQLGHPHGARAVGMANARNPIAIVIPCHRVIGAGADLRGYAGGLERKRWLLAHEANQAPVCVELRTGTDTPVQLSLIG